MKQDLQEYQAPSMELIYLEGLSILVSVSVPVEEEWIDLDGFEPDDAY